MAVLTIEQIKNIWVDGFTPTQSDYVNLYDSLFAVISPNGGTATDFNSALNQNVVQGNKLIFTSNDGNIEISDESIKLILGNKVCELVAKSNITNKGVIRFKDGNLYTELVNVDSSQTLGLQTKHILPTRSGTLAMESDATSNHKSIIYDTQQYESGFQHIIIQSSSPNKISFPKGLYFDFDFTQVNEFLHNEYKFDVMLGTVKLIVDYTVPLSNNASRNFYVGFPKINTLNFSQAEISEMIGKNLTIKVSDDIDGLPVDGQFRNIIWGAFEQINLD